MFQQLSKRVVNLSIRLNITYEMSNRKIYWVKFPSLAFVLSLEIKIYYTVQNVRSHRFYTSLSFSRRRDHIIMRQ